MSKLFPAAFALLVGIALAAHASTQPRAGAPALGPVRIEVVEGRVLVYEAGVAPRYFQRGEHLDLSSKGLIEVGALGEVALSWSNRASLRAFGPVVFEWDSAPRASTSPAGGIAPVDLDWQVSALGRVELESRQANVRLRLPGGFVARVRDAALALSSRPGGECVVEHRAGEPVLVQLPEVDGRVQPALRIAGGERARLTRDLFHAAMPDGTRSAAPWPHVHWPWSGSAPVRAPADPPIVAAPAHDPIEPRVTAEPSPVVHDFELAPIDEDPAATAVAAIEPAPASDADESSASYREWQWRGLSRSALQFHGACAVEASPKLRARALDDGAWLVALDARADRALWCFSDICDVALEPGSLIIVDADGRLRAHWGTIRVHEPTPARPRFADLARTRPVPAQTPVPPMK